MKKKSKIWLWIIIAMIILAIGIAGIILFKDTSSLQQVAGSSSSVSSWGGGGAIS